MASQRYKEKRFETDDVYRGLRALNAKYNTIGWTAAQTQRDTRQLKILSGDKVAEDIGKIVVPVYFGANAYCVKPIDRDELESTVAAVLKA